MYFSTKNACLTKNVNTFEFPQKFWTILIFEKKNFVFIKLEIQTDKKKINVLFIFVSGEPPVFSPHLLIYFKLLELEILHKSSPFFQQKLVRTKRTSDF